MLRSMISSSTRLTPLGAVAVPVISNCSSTGLMRPSIGSVITVWVLLFAGTLWKSKKAIRPTLKPPLVLPSPPTNRPRGVASMCLSPS